MINPSITPNITITIYDTRYSPKIDLILLSISLNLNASEKLLDLAYIAIAIGRIKPIIKNKIPPTNNAGSIAITIVYGLVKSPKAKEIPVNRANAPNIIKNNI